MDLPRILMRLNHILISIPLLIIFRIVFSKKYSKKILLITNILVLFLLQPSSSIRHFSFWIPIFTIHLLLLTWLVIKPKEVRKESSVVIDYLLIIFIIIFIYLLTPYLSKIDIVNYYPPRFLSVLLFFISAAIFLYILSYLPYKFGQYATIITLLLIFVFLKQPKLSLWIAQSLRSISNQNPILAKSNDFLWLGYSYIAFRLIHLVLDEKSGRLQTLSFVDLINYCLFFPSLTAGPIDRIQHFQNEIQNRNENYFNDWLDAGKRIFFGIFKKFVVADALAIIALQEDLIVQIYEPIWMWIAVFSYSFMIYFDFSGYTDIAIGLGLILGIKLPENFNKPYLAENITIFWNKWHITLTQWFRAYFFNPFTRLLKTKGKRIPSWIILLITQITTMLLVGLWHGVRLNFIIWGLWNGIGLFIHNQISRIIVKTKFLESAPALNNFYKTISTMMTFVYISLGWIWFAITDVHLAVNTYLRLFNLG